MSKDSPRVAEYLLAFAGLVCGVSIPPLVYFLIILLFDPQFEPSHSSSDLGHWILGLTVPIGAALGIAVVALGVHLRKARKLQWQSVAISWIIATLAGYPVGLLWASISSFGLSNDTTASVVYYLVWLVVALVWCGATSVMMPEK